MSKEASWREIIRQGLSQPGIPIATLPETVHSTLTEVAEHLAKSPGVRAYLKRLSKGPCTDCPDSDLDDLVQYVARQTGNLDKSDSELNLRFLTTYIQPVFQLEREWVLEAVKKCLNATSPEKDLIKNGAGLAAAVDRLWAHWFAEVVVSYQSLDEAGRQAFKTLAEEELPEYDYTVFDYSPVTGITNRRSWAQAFPEEIKKVCGKLGQLLLECDDRLLYDYFQCLSQAYGCLEIEQLEDLWRKVDEAWIKLTGRIIPVHGMESGYEHPRCVSPELRLAVRTVHGAEMIARTKNHTVAYAGNQSLELARVIRQKMQHLDMGIFVDAIRAGVGANFRIAGQAVPNRQDVMAEGSKIFLDFGNVASRVEEFKELLDRHCEPKTADILRELITVESRLKMVAGHECGHPVGRTAEIDTNLGKHLNLLEEAKASLVGYVVWLLEDQSEFNRRQVMALVISNILRTLNQSYLSNQTFAPYVRENLVTAHLLLTKKFIDLTDKGIRVNWEMLKNNSLFDELQHFVSAILRSYEQADITILTELNCSPDEPHLRKLINWINRKIEK